MTFRQILAQEFAPYAALTADQLERLHEHFKLLRRWNAKLNLTRILDPVEAARLHYCESLYLGLRLPRGPLRIADVGSGPGFPGLPVAVLRPDCQVTLIESHQRKAVFLREATRALPNVRVVARRAEDLARDPQESFDWVVARAVAPRDVLNLPLAANFALLVGLEDAHSLGGEPLPWGQGRFLAVVPRGT
jgi:16S rRNA (guanine527-N7)-methyltransferase